MEGHYLGAGCGCMAAHSSDCRTDNGHGRTNSGHRGSHHGANRLELGDAGLSSYIDDCRDCRGGFAAILWLANAVGGFDVLWRYAWAGIQVAFYYAAGAITSGFWWMVYGLMWAGDKLITFREEVKMAALPDFQRHRRLFRTSGGKYHVGVGSDCQMERFGFSINSLGESMPFRESSELRRLTKSKKWILAVKRRLKRMQLLPCARPRISSMQRELPQTGKPVKMIWRTWHTGQNPLGVTMQRTSRKAWQDAVDYDNQKKAEQAMTAALQAGQAATGLFSNGTYGVTDSVAQNLSDINDNTKGISDSLEISSEDLKYLRDLAERDVINRFTTAEIKVEMTNHNTIEDNRDLDGMFDYMGEKLEETLLYTAEGVHV